MHSMQAFIPGNITRTLPLKPSVPPSTNGIMLVKKKDVKRNGQHENTSGTVSIAEQDWTRFLGPFSK